MDKLKKESCVYFKLVFILKKANNQERMRIIRDKRLWLQKYEKVILSVLKEHQPKIKFFKGGNPFL